MTTNELTAPAQSFSEDGDNSDSITVKDLLDRAEMLEPTNLDLKDLRRSYVDQDLRSIMRVAQADDDLRKAVCEQNLHSIFRLLDTEDLRKLVLQDNRHSMWRLLDHYTSSAVLQGFRRLEQQELNYCPDSISRGQIRSKRWLVRELEVLKLELGVVYLCAGWYGTLAAMLFESSVELDKVRSFDIDPSCAVRAEIVNQPWVQDHWRFKACTQDILDINYRVTDYTVIRSDGTEARLTDTPDTIINTSCEHIKDFDRWWNMIPEGILVVLQSNDLEDLDEHVNCVTSLEEFAAITPMSELLYEGELDLGSYKRFMRIGYR